MFKLTCYLFLNCLYRTPEKSFVSRPRKKISQENKEYFLNTYSKLIYTYSVLRW